MNPSGIFSRLRAAATKLTARFRPPAMIGSPPSQRPMWHDPAEHAKDFAHHYADDLDLVVTQRMVDLKIPHRQIGARDVEHGIQIAAFIPHEGGGGGNSPDRRLNLDSGILNPELSHSCRRCHTLSVNRNTDSGPPAHVEIGIMMPASTSSR
jgi:hypothetical protein